MDNAEIRSRCATSMLLMGQMLVPDMFTAKSPAFHKDLAKHLRDVGQRQTVIVAPRGHAKSSVAAGLLVLWHIFFEDAWRKTTGAPELPGAKFVVLVSKTQREAKSRLQTIKHILGSDGDYSSPLRRLLGDWGENTARQWSTDQITLRDGTRIMAMGTGQQARGLKTGHRRPTLIVADDPEDETNTRTAEAMESNRRWLLQAVLPSLDETVGRAVIIGTPLHVECMVVTLRDTSGWRALWYENDAQSNSCRWFDSATREWVTYRKVLWPDYVTRRKLLDRRESAKSMNMLSSYYREWEAKVVGDEDAIFRPDYMQSWYGEFDFSGDKWIHVKRRHGNEVEEERRRVLTFVGADPASSTSRRADKTAAVNIAVDEGGDIYVLPSLHRRLEPVGVVTEIARNHKWVNPDRGLVEVTAGFEYIIWYLLRDHKIRYVRDTPTRRKTGEGSRIESIQQPFSQGKIWIWEGPEVWDVMREQLLMYPRGKDDFIDAFEKAIRIAGKGRPYSGPMRLGGEGAGGSTRTFDPMLS